MLELGTNVNQYRIQKHLGTGAFVEVYLATHTFLNVDRAIKVLHKETPQMSGTLYKTYEDRYKLEWQLAARIHHPNLIEVYDLFEWNDALVAVIEYASNGTLKNQLELTGGPMPEDYVVDVLRHCAAGVNQLHQLATPPLVHCYLNPETIVFDKHGTAKITNLGRSRSKAASTLHNMGQPEDDYDSQYRAPEFERGKLAPTLDIYSLGCVAFEMLTGKSVVAARVKSPKMVEPSVPEWLDTIVTRMLSDRPGFAKWDMNDPDKRYVDVAHMLETLNQPQQVISGELLQKMDAAFSFEELRDISAILGVDYESIGGDNKTSFVRELIRYFQRRENIGELIEQLRKERPQTPW
jgi:serine/threonine-protein kinase